jgi:sporulation protein YlmC with PRC-barrel domain
MKQSLNILKDHTIGTNDLFNGNIKDFLFDEKRWVIRYIDAEFEDSATAEKVLVPRILFRIPDGGSKLLPTRLSKQEIENCPKAKDHLPVSRKYEEKLSKYYQISPYWRAAYLRTTVGFLPPRPLNVLSESVSEKDIDSILRSFVELKGYNIEATDGNVGHIEDLIIDYQDWQIVYAVIDTSNWLPWSKKVIIPISRMTDISYTESLVKIDLKTETIKNAPEYNPEKMLEEEFERGVIDFYSQSLVV